MVREAELRVHWQLQFVVIPSVHLGQLPHVRQVCLADENAARVLVRHFAQFPKYFVYFRQIVCVNTRQLFVAVIIDSSLGSRQVRLAF